MRSIIIGLLLTVLVPAYCYSNCVEWKLHGLRVDGQIVDVLVEKAKSTFHDLYFESAYAHATKNQSTTMTLAEFQSRYLPQLRNAFENELKATPRDDKDKLVAEAIQSLPSSDTGLYQLYCKHYAYENFLYEWTLEQLATRGIKSDSFQFEHTDNVRSTPASMFIRTKLEKARKILFLGAILDQLDFSGKSETKLEFNARVEDEIKRLAIQ